MLDFIQAIEHHNHVPDLLADSDQPGFRNVKPEMEQPIVIKPKQIGCVPVSIWIRGAFETFEHPYMVGTVVIKDSVFRSVIEAKLASFKKAGCFVNTQCVYLLTCKAILCVLLWV